MTFFPQEDYKVPSSGGNYLKLLDGENNFRVLSSAIIGWVYWTGDNKPMRSSEKFTETPNIRLDKDGNPTKIKHFWAFVVYNYETKAIQVMEVTQVTIQRAMHALIKNKKWGDPKKYDITINRVGEGFDTEYNVVPTPHSELEEGIKEKYEGMSIKLENLYSGDDPFKKEESGDFSKI